jgi:DNA-directed RNA polymerase specialized sigma24 family protein
VRDAAARRQDAESDFRRLLVEARDEGYSLSEIARACGLTKQGVRWIIRREETKT